MDRYVFYRCVSREALAHRKPIENLLKNYRKSIEHPSNIENQSNIYRNLSKSSDFFWTFLCQRELYCTHFSDMPGGPVGGHPSRSCGSVALLCLGSSASILDRFGYFTQVATLGFYNRILAKYLAKDSTAFGITGSPCGLDPTN